MDATKDLNIQKCGEILMHTENANNKTKKYTFHCVFCDTDCDQWKQFSIHLEEEHLHHSTDKSEETIIIEPEIKLEYNIEIEETRNLINFSDCTKSNNYIEDSLESMSNGSKIEKSSTDIIVKNENEVDCNEQFENFHLEQIDDQSSLNKSNIKEFPTDNTKNKLTAKTKKNSQNLQTGQKNASMYVKIKSGGQFSIIKICGPESEDFTPDGIIASIVDKLNLDIEGRALQMKDRDGAIINFEELPGIISQYACSNCFFVELCFDGPDTLGSGINLKKELESYLKRGEFSSILIEYDTKQTLSDSSRRNLVRESINFLRQRSGNYPKREDKIALAEAIVSLFPTYKVENSDCGGIDLFFNPSANTGYLVAKLKNFNSKRRKLTTPCPKVDEKHESNSGSDGENRISQDDLDFFKNCLNTDKLIIKEKLQQTVKARIKYCTTQENVLQDFPIFLFDSSLILFDFELRYGAFKANELFNNWNKYKHFISEISNEAGGQSLESFSGWSEDTIPFLKLLKLLPSTASGRDTKRVKLKDSVESFITFEEIHTPFENYKLGFHQPKIIAVGENKSSISKYYISINGRCINLPLNFNFTQKHIEGGELRILIELYKKYELLWQVENIEFGIQTKREEEMKKIVEDLKENHNIEKTLFDVQDKINYINRLYTKDKERQLQCELENAEFIPLFDNFEELSFLSDSQGPFKCSTCNEILTKYEQYHIHVAEHNNTIPFKCTLCEKGFDKFYKFVLHNKRHLGVNSFHCDVCGKGYPFKAELDWHLTSHTGDKPFLCQICGAGFRSRHGHDNHIRRHEKRFRYECHICKYGFNHLHRLNSHVKSHLNIRDILCNVCGKGFTARKYLLRHKLIHDDEKRYKCNECGKAFAQDAGLRAHRKQHQPYSASAENKNNLVYTFLDM